jgi:hypothetical protein
VLVLATTIGGCSGEEVPCVCYRTLGDENPETLSAASAAVCEALAEGSEEFVYCQAPEVGSLAAPLEPVAVPSPWTSDLAPWGAPVPVERWRARGRSSP